MTMYLIGVAAAFLLGIFVHEPLANTAARMRGKTRVVAHRGPRVGKGASGDAA